MSEAKLGNVAAAIVVGGLGEGAGAEAGAPPEDGLIAAVADRLGDLFFETWLVGVEAGPEAAGRRLTGEVATILDLLEATRAERVLIVDVRAPLPDPETLLALTAWPERQAVVLEDVEGAPTCAIYLREAALGRGSAGGCTIPGQLHPLLEVERVQLDVLGLSDAGLA